MDAQPLEEHGSVAGSALRTSSPTTGRVLSQSRYGGPEVLELARKPRPNPGPAQVLVRVHAASVNARDWHVMRGEPRLARLMDRTVFALRRPRIGVRGTDLAGVVEAVGAAVTRWEPGDAVFGEGTGTFAEYALASADQLAEVPAGVPFDQAAALPLNYLTAHFALAERAGLREGETVLVHGASGGVGTAAVQLGVAHGLTVIGTAGTEEGRRLVIEQGAHEVLDHRAPDYLEQLNGLTGGRGADVILEMLANVNLDKDLGVLARGGRVVVIGSRGTVEINPRQAMTRDAAILGMTLFNTTPREQASIHAAIGAGLEAGTLRPVVGRELPLAEAARAHEEVLKPGAYGKIVLVP